MYDVLSTKPVLNKVSILWLPGLIKLKTTVLWSAVTTFSSSIYFLSSWPHTRHWCRSLKASWSPTSGTAQTHACRGDPLDTESWSVWKCFLAQRHSTDPLDKTKLLYSNQSPDPVSCHSSICFASSLVILSTLRIPNPFFPLLI